MKLKKKHLLIGKTISWFVDRNYYPDFIEPTIEQIKIFIQIESEGRKNITDEQIALVEPMLNGKIQYDLQINMLHEEVLEWVVNKWGWYYPIDNLFKNVWSYRQQCPMYIKFLVKLIRRLKDSSGIVVMSEYSGFNTEQKQRLFS